MLQQSVLLLEDRGFTDKCGWGGIWHLVGLAFLKSLAQLKPLRRLHIHQRSKDRVYFSV